MKKLMSALAILLAMMCASPGAMAQPSCKDGMDVLFFAQEVRPIDVSRCLKAGVDVNARTALGSAPLHWAAAYASSPSVLRVLLKAGADVNARSGVLDVGEGMTPLHLIFILRREYTAESVGVLLKAGADVNARSKKKRTPLHFAAQYAHDPEVVDALLKAGADVNARDWAKSTPLHQALANSFIGKEIAKILLKAGADGNAKDDWEKTPFEIIRRRMKKDADTWEWAKKYLR